MPKLLNNLEPSEPNKLENNLGDVEPPTKYDKAKSVMLKNNLDVLSEIKEQKDQGFATGPAPSNKPNVETLGKASQGKSVLDTLNIYEKTKIKVGMALGNKIKQTMDWLYHIDHERPELAKKVTYSQMLKPFKTDEEKKALAYALQSSDAFPELLKNLGSSIVSIPISGLGAMGAMRIADFKKGGIYEAPKNIAKTIALPITVSYELIAGDPEILEAGAKAQEKIATAMTYEPKTKKGIELTEKITVPFKKIEEWSQYAGDFWENKVTKAAKKIGVKDSTAQKIGANAGASIKTAGVLSPAAIPILKKAGMGQLIKQTPKLAKPGVVATPATPILKKQMGKRYLGAKKTPAPKTPPPPASGSKFYSGLPINKLAKFWTDKIGTPVWDNLILKQIPKQLDRLPGKPGSLLNRALNRKYMGDLKNTERFIKNKDTMAHFQSVGREYAIDLGNRLQSFSNKSQLKMGEYLRGEMKGKKLKPDELAVAGEAKQVLTDLGRQAVDVGLLSEKVFFENVGRYMPRLYTKAEYATSLKKYGLKNPKKLDLARFKKRKDIPKKVREEMGEILTPGFPVAKGIVQLTHDIEMAKFFNGISRNPDWAIARTPVLSKSGKPVVWKSTSYDPLTGKKVVKYNTKKKHQIDPPEGWVKLGKDKKLGELSEAYVHPEVAAELKPMMKVMSKPTKYWRKMLGAWKYGKVIVSPKTHARNLFSNSVLAHVGGMPMQMQPIYLYKAARALKTKNKYWKILKEKTDLLDQSTFTQAELKSLLNDSVESQIKGASAASLPEKMGKIGGIWNGLKSGANKMANLYELEEAWFKAAKFIHNIERRKMGAVAAAADAEKSLFNYSKLTRFQEAYKNHVLGAPFATFTFKSAPMMAENLIKYPWRYAMPAYMLYKLEEAAMDLIGDTWEQAKEKRKLRPEWMGGTAEIPSETRENITNSVGRLWTTRVPVVDKEGREYYWDMRSYLPWGGLSDAGGVTPMTQPFVSSMAKVLYNKDPFFGDEVIKDTDIVGKSDTEQQVEKGKIVGKQLFQDLVPTPVLDIMKAVSSAKNIPDYRGRRRPLKVVLADVLGGVKMYPVDYADQLSRLVNRYDVNKGGLARKLKRQIETIAVQRQTMLDEGTLKTSSTIKDMDERIIKKVAQLHGMADLLIKISKTAKKSGVVK